MLSNKRFKMVVLACSVGSIGVGLSAMTVASASTQSRVTIRETRSAAAVALPALAKNVNFKGTWVSTAGDWTVKSENLKTGACTGTTTFVGYSFSGCKVTGHKYRFVVSQNGTTYRSINTGTISGNTVTGSFNDGRGASRYIAHRR